MADFWFPGGVRDPAPPELWGTHAPGCGPKFLLHTTEGALGVYSPDTRRGDARRYFGHTYWPSYTLARERSHGYWKVFCHIPANRSARALANAAGGAETNRANVSQVEIAWKAAEIASLPGEALDELARLLAWEHEVRGVPLVSTVRWVGSEGYGVGAAQRLSPAAWVAYRGVLGHQHVPEGNSHWDPGRFPVEALLSRAREIVGEGDVVNEQDKVDIANQVFARVVEGPMGLRGQVGIVGVAVSEARREIGVIRNLVMAAAEEDTEAAAQTVTDPALCDRLAGVWSARADELRRAAG